MRIIKPSYEVMYTYLNDPEVVRAIYRHIEKAARVCYKSETSMTDESSEKIIKNLILHGHEAMLEHAYLTVKFIVDRGVSHELVRHRLASFAQESTRYCNYSKDKFGNEITFIKPTYIKEESPSYRYWRHTMRRCETTYFAMLNDGLKPEEARCVLPNSLKTEVVVTANMREWRHILKLRAAGTTGKPHPQMLEVMVPLLNELRLKLPVLFGDILPLDGVVTETNADGKAVAGRYPIAN